MRIYQTMAGMVAVGALSYGTAALAQRPRPDTPEVFIGFNPAQCAVVPTVTEQYSRRTLDSSAYAVTGDTLLRSTIDTTRMCQERSGLTAKEWELLHVARVHLALGADADAKSTRERYLALIAKQSPRVQAWGNLLIIIDDTAARPVRLADALEAINRIERLPVTEFWANTAGNRMIAAAARSQWNDSLAYARANRTLAVWWSLDERIRPMVSDDVEAAYLLLAEQALRLHGSDAANKVVDSVRKYLGTGTRAFEGQMHNYTNVIGQPAKSIQAKFWFRRQDTLARPNAGTVTIIGYDPWGGCSGFCISLGDMIKRLQQRFGARGLEIIIVKRTVGYVRDTAPIAPRIEADDYRSTILEKYQFPGILAVMETPHRWNIEGRRFNELNQFERGYPYAEFVVVDPQGRVRYISPQFEPWMEKPLADMIERLFSSRGS